MGLSLIPIYEGAPSLLDSLHTVENAGYALAGLYAANADPVMQVIDRVRARHVIAPVSSY